MNENHNIKDTTSMTKGAEEIVKKESIGRWYQSERWHITPKNGEEGLKIASREKRSQGVEEGLRCNKKVKKNTNRNLIG